MRPVVNWANTVEAENILPSMILIEIFELIVHIYGSLHTLWYLQDSNSGVQKFPFTTFLAKKPCHWRGILLSPLFHKTQP